MAGTLRPVLLLVGESSADPIAVDVEGYGLQMVVVNKESLGLLGGEWDTRGIYLLLGRAGETGKYTAYVGEATGQSLRNRISQHVRTEKNWDRALLITGSNFDSAAIGWLEGRLHDVLANAAAAEVLNRVQPKDETIPEYRRDVLERYVEPVTLALRALGCPPDTADQKPTVPVRTRRVFRESLADLIDAGLLKPGTRLRPTRRKYDEPATVLEDGSLQVGDEVFAAVSTAAQRVSGNQTEPGWEFWAAPSGDGSLVSLYELRDRLRAGGASRSGSTGQAPTVRQGRTKAPPRTDYRVTVAELVDAGLVEDGETVVALRKRVGNVEGTLSASGTLTVRGETYASLSGAAKAVSGTSSEAGWEYWAVRRGGQLVSLFELRRQFIAARGET